jgi:hypothetical protein
MDNMSITVHEKLSGEYLGVLAAQQLEIGDWG